jgi:hypothetical protein
MMRGSITFMMLRIDSSWIKSGVRDGGKVGIVASGRAAGLDAYLWIWNLDIQLACC